MAPTVQYFGPIQPVDEQQITDQNVIEKLHWLTADIDRYLKFFCISSASARDPSYLLPNWVGKHNTTQICACIIHLGLSSRDGAGFLCQASFLQPLGPFAILGTMTVDEVLLEVIGSIEALFSVALAKTMDRF